jgi:hypothetical protein
MKAHMGAYQIYVAIGVECLVWGVCMNRNNCKP